MARLCSSSARRRQRGTPIAIDLSLSRAIGCRKTAGCSSTFQRERLCPSFARLSDVFIARPQPSVAWRSAMSALRPLAMSRPAVKVMMSARLCPHLFGLFGLYALQASGRRLVFDHILSVSGRRLLFDETYAFVATKRSWAKGGGGSLRSSLMRAVVRTNDLITTIQTLLEPPPGQPSPSLQQPQHGPTGLYRSALRAAIRPLAVATEAFLSCSVSGSNRSIVCNVAAREVPAGPSAVLERTTDGGDRFVGVWRVLGDFVGVSSR